MVILISVVVFRIKGIVRVGDFAKGLLLRGSRDVYAVAMCQKPPTKALLESVLSLLPEKLKEVQPEKDYLVKDQNFKTSFRLKPIKFNKQNG